MEDKQKDVPLTDNSETQSKVLLGNIALFIFIITVLGYIVAYECELLAALKYGYDIELISITTTVLIKNNLYTFVCFTIMLSGVIIEILKKKEKKKKKKQEKETSNNITSQKYNNIFNCKFFSYLKNKILAIYKKLKSIYSSLRNKISNYPKLSKSIALILLVFFILILIYNYFNYISYLLPNYVLPFIVLFIVFLVYKMINETNMINFICYISLLIVLTVPFVFTLFCSPLSPFDLHENYEAFNYENKRYILLRQYDNVLIAKHIDIVNTDNEVPITIFPNRSFIPYFLMIDKIQPITSNVPPLRPYIEPKQNKKVNKAGEILYLPLSTLKEGIVFYHVKRKGKDNYEIIQ